MGEKIEKLIFSAAADRHNHRRANHAIDAAASAIRIVALMDCLCIVDPDRAKRVAEELRKL